MRNMYVCMYRYACTSSGHLFEVHYKRIEILKVWHLIPDTPILSLSLHEAFCVTGSEDGILRVWPLDFSAVFIEAGKGGERGRGGARRSLKFSIMYYRT